MTKFLDGPAAGVHLALHRAPFFLRVVCNADNKWDALDQPGDTPTETERVYVYRVKKYLGTAHVNRGRHGSGFFPMVEYEYYPEQPPQSVFHSSPDWVIWTDARKSEFEEFNSKNKS